jgi:hypothetical protein
MATLLETRNALKTLLNTATGGRCETFLPDRVTPPMAILTAASPYVEPGNTVGSVLVRYSVTLVVQRATNKVETEALDSLLEDVWVAIANDRNFYAVNVTEPFILPANNAEYYACTVVTQTTITL